MADRNSPKFKHVPTWVWELVDTSPQAFSEISRMYDGQPDELHALKFLDMLTASPAHARPQSENEWAGLSKAVWWAHNNLPKIADIGMGDLGKQLLSLVEGEQKPWSKVMKELAIFRDKEIYYYSVEDEDLVKDAHLARWFGALHTSILMGPTDTKRPSPAVLGHLLKTVPLHQVLNAIAEFESADSPPAFQQKMHAIRGRKLPEWKAVTPPIRHQAAGKTTLIFNPTTVEQLEHLDRLSDFFIMDLGLKAINGESIVTAFLPEALVTTILGRPVSRQVEERDADMDYVIKHLGQEHANSLTMTYRSTRKPQSPTPISNADATENFEEAMSWYTKVLTNLPHARARRAEYLQRNELVKALPSNDWSDQPYDPSVPSQAAKAFKAGRLLSPTKEGRKAQTADDWIHIYELERFVRSDVPER